MIAHSNLCAIASAADSCHIYGYREPENQHAAGLFFQKKGNAIPSLKNSLPYKIVYSKMTILRIVQLHKKRSRQPTRRENHYQQPEANRQSLHTSALLYPVGHASGLFRLQCHNGFACLSKTALIGQNNVIA